MKSVLYRHFENHPKIFQLVVLNNLLLLGLRIGQKLYFLISLLQIEHNSSVKIRNSTINGELEIVDNSFASLDETTVNGTPNDRTIKVNHSSSISLWKSNITGATGGGDVIWIYNNSSISSNGDSSTSDGRSNITAPSAEHGIRFELSSSGDISTTNITSVDRQAIYLQHNSSLAV